MEVLRRIEKDLSSGESFDDHLELISQVISQRNHTEEIWNQCIQIVKNAIVNKKTIRSYRAILVLTRNISVNHKSHVITIIKNFSDFITNQTNESYEYYESILSIYCQILANISHNNLSNKSYIIATFDSFGTNLKKLPQDPTIIFLSNVLLSADNKVEQVNDDESFASSNNTPFQQLFQSEYLLPLLYQYFHEIDFDNFSEFNRVLVKILFAVISNEGFGNWLRTQSNSDQLNWIKLAQLLVPENSSWNNEQLLGLLGWLHESFVLLCPIVIDTIGTENHEAIEISIILDIIGELCQYHIFKQGLISYKFIKPLIKLFGTIQLHTKPANMLKPATDEGFSYPHVKSTIIEIISYLSHETPEIQDEVRELHGLNLVLSNCVIDDNNPFIKERAITCLKFLLANNPKNQQVVRELEESKA